MTRRLRELLFIGTIAVASKASAGDDRANKCVIATKGGSVVAKACAAGGIVKARAKMKELVKVAKKKGTAFGCDDCHEEGKSKYDLTENAKDDFKKLLAAVRAK